MTTMDTKPDWWKVGGEYDCRSGVGHSGHPGSPGPNYDGPHIGHVEKVTTTDDLEMRCDCGHEWMIPAEQASLLVERRRPGR